MGRPLRVDVGGYVYHALNRASARATMFESPIDYRQFEQRKGKRCQEPFRRLALDRGVPSGRITDLLNGRRGVTADKGAAPGYFGNGPQFWLEVQSQYDLAVVEGERGEEIARRVKPADAA